MRLATCLTCINGRYSTLLHSRSGDRYGIARGEPLANDIVCAYRFACSAMFRSSRNSENCDGRSSFVLRSWTIVYVHRSVQVNRWNRVIWDGPRFDVLGGLGCSVQRIRLGPQVPFSVLGGKESLDDVKAGLDERLFMNLIRPFDLFENAPWRTGSRRRTTSESE